MSDATNETADRIRRLFGGDSFKFARWGGAISPAVIGLDAAGGRLFGEAVRVLAGHAGAAMANGEAEANLLIYVMKGWRDAARAPNLPDFLPDLPALIARLEAAGANRYRVFAFDDAGAIRASITLLRYDEQMRAAPVDYIALTEAALALLVFDEGGVSVDRPVAMAEFDNGERRAMLAPFHAALLKAAYDPAIPAGSKDPALALRLAARIGLAGADDAA